MIRTLGIGVVLLLVGVLLGSVATDAFTTDTGDRDATVTVVTDDDGLLRLIDPIQGGLVQQTGDGRLTIDFTRGGAAGATEDVVFTFGSSADPASDHAFRIVNQGTRATTAEVSYDLSASASDSEPGERNVEFAFHLDRGSDGSIETSATVGEEEAPETIPDVGVGDTIYVVVTVDTQGLSASADLTGTLNVTA